MESKRKKSVRFNLSPIYEKQSEEKAPAKSGSKNNSHKLSTGILKVKNKKPDPPTKPSEVKYFTQSSYETPKQKQRTSEKFTDSKENTEQ